MGLWSFYFLGKAFLYFKGYIRFDVLLNLLLALALVVPLPKGVRDKKVVRMIRTTLAAVGAFLLLWHETWFPPLLRTIRLLSETGGVSGAYIIRFLRESVNPVALVVLVLIFAACYLLNKRITLAPIAFAAILAVPLFSEKPIETSLDSYVDDFFRKEETRVVRFAALRPDSPSFDIILMHICSLSWDDLRLVGLEQAPFLKQFDVLLRNFNTVSSYTNPSAIRVLRAPCGQVRHSELYRDADRECYLLESLRRLGYTAYAAKDNEAPSYGFSEDIMAFGKSPPTFDMTDLPVRQYSFDRTPIYDQIAILDRWWQMRTRSGEERAVIYFDINTLHGGTHQADDARWWTRKRRDLYRQFAERLFRNTEDYFRRLASTGKNFVVVFVPEHGMALRGSTIQAPDIREVPLPDITTVPVGIKLIGPGMPFQPDRQITVDKPTSYLAIAHLLGAFLAAPRFDADALLRDDVIKLVPETAFLSENEASLVVKKDDKAYSFGKDRTWTELPQSALR